MLNTNNLIPGRGYGYRSGQDQNCLRFCATKQQVVAWLKSFCAGGPIDILTRRRFIDTFINFAYLFDPDPMIYYNIKDVKQVPCMQISHQTGGYSSIHLCPLLYPEKSL